MKVHYQDDMVTLYHGDCLDVLASIPDNSVDSIVTDPPYGLSNTKPQQVADVLKAWVTGDTEAVPAKRGGFMGKDWDSFVPPPAVWAECMRVLKPGGHMAVFAGARTQDLMGLAIRLAGFEIRDTLAWIYGSGFPKSLDVSKAIDKLAGAEREVIGPRIYADGNTHVEAWPGGENGYEGWRSPGAPVGPGREDRHVTAPATHEAVQWDGWGTSLKPAIEPIILARKPLDGTVANNVLEHGVGGINIDASRVGTDEDTSLTNGVTAIWHEDGTAKAGIGGGSPAGRFPANVLLDEHAATEMDKQSGVSKSSIGKPRGAASGDGWGMTATGAEYDDKGGASRFFPVFKYQAKAPKSERPVIEREDGTKIQHPTVKPLALMRWLVRLITPPGGLVLDPFAGSGSTIEAALTAGFRPIGVEMEDDYLQLITTRIARCRGENSPTVGTKRDENMAETLPLELTPNTVREAE